MRMKIDPYRRLEQLRDKERNDETLTPSETKELWTICKKHPYLLLSVGQMEGYEKGCRD